MEEQMPDDMNQSRENAQGSSTSSFCSEGVYESTAQWEQQVFEMAKEVLNDVRIPSFQDPKPHGETMTD
jgi:hypothetical protein